ncbi:hypothetical protein [Flectobacillus sp. BAB-3569]|nr:hypothetical protein [Flectobacillus sp. BAB-3569]
MKTTLQVWIISPRIGKFTQIVLSTGIQTFSSPSTGSGHDWI